MAVPLTEKGALSAAPLGYGAELERIEIELLLEGIFRHYGFDFRAYAYASIRRRLWKRIEDEDLSSVSQLQALVLHDEAAMERLVLDLTALCWYPFANEHTLMPALGIRARNPAFLDEQKRHLGELVRAMTRPARERRTRR